MVSSVPSAWAVEQFGDAALEVMEHVVKGLRRGQRAARSVQIAARGYGATDNHPYGSMWNSRYQMVVEQFELADLPGYEAIKPKGASYRLAVVNGRVLIPFRHATTMNKSITQAKLGSLIPRRISRDNGVLPERTLFDEPDAPVTDSTDRSGQVDAGEGPTVAEVAATARALNLKVIYIGYVANADSDEIQAAWWGTPTSLEDDGSMVWSPERLDMSIATELRVVSDHVASGDADAPDTGTADTPGFAQGDEPGLDIAPRPHRANHPISETEPDAPDVAAEDDE